MKNILWLSSWYPNINNPYEGDFIQRHAKAVSLYIPLTVIHVTQYGEKTEIRTDNTETHQNDNLREIIVYFKFKKTGLTFLDKLRYNRKYFLVYKRLIREYFKENELPALVHLHIPMKAGVIAKWIKKRWQIPYIVSEHATTYWPQAADNFSKRSQYYQAAVRKIFQDADLVTNVSKTAGNLIKKLFDVKKIDIIPNVVNTDYFSIASGDGKEFRFIHVSTLNDRKNPEGMLRAFREFFRQRTDWKLVIVGPISTALKNLIHEFNLQTHVTFTGEITYREVAIQMQQASAFVLFSRHENLPCVILEALCCGLPVIATDVGGVRDVINKENGLLVDSENTDQLVAALNTMIDTYSFFDRDKIAKEARIKFNYQTVGKQFISLYDTVLKMP